MRNLVLFSALILSGIPGGAAAADSEIEELKREMRKLQQRLESLEARPAPQAAEPKADKSLEEMTTDSAQTASAPAARGTQLGTSYIRDIVSNTTVGGYASSEYEDFKDQDSTFDQHRFVLNVSSQLHKRLKLYTELEYEHGTVIEVEGSTEGTGSIEDDNGNGVIDADEAEEFEFSGDSSNGKSGEIAVEQAWLEYDFNDQLGFRTGVILMPFGRFNLYHDDDLQNLTDRPLVARRVTPSTWSEAGAGLVGRTDIGETGSVSGEIYFVNGLDDGISSGGGAFREARGSRESDNNNNKAVVGRAVVSPALGYELGVSGYHGDYDDDDTEAVSGWAADWLATFGDFRLLGEYAYFSIDEGVNADGAAVPDTISGVYAEANYHFWFAGLNETFLGGTFEDPKFVLTYRYNYAEIERFEDSTLDETSHVVGLAYRPIQSFVMKTEYQFNEGDLERADADGFIGSVALGF